MSRPSSYDDSEYEPQFDAHEARRVRFDDDDEWADWYRSRDDRRRSPSLSRRHISPPRHRPVHYFPPPPRVRSRSSSRSRSRERVSSGWGGPPPPPPPPRRPLSGDYSSSDDEDGVSGGNSSSESEYPKKGKTRIPSRLISKRALIDLGYPFTTEGNTVIVQKALGERQINELIELSKQYETGEHAVASPSSPPPPSPPPPPRVRVERHDHNDYVRPLSDFERAYRLGSSVVAERRLQNELTALAIRVRTYERRLEEAQLQRLRAEDEAVAAFSAAESRYSNLVYEKEQCEKQLVEQQEKAASLDLLNSRLKELKNDEVEVLLRREKASQDQNQESKPGEESVASSRRELLRDLTNRLFTIKVEANQVSQELRSAEAAEDASRDLLRKLSRLIEDAEEADKHRSRVHVERRNAFRVFGGDTDEVKEAKHNLEIARRARRSVLQELEELRQNSSNLQRRQYEPAPPPPPPPGPQPIIINNRHYFDDDTDSRVSFSDSDSALGQDVSARAPPPVPVIIHNRPYGGSDTEPLSDASSNGYGAIDNEGVLRQTYKTVEKEGLSVSFPLNKGVRAIHIQDADDDVAALTSEAKAWKEDKTVLTDGVSSTELRVIHAAEYSEDETGIGKTILMCLDGPRDRESLQSAQMRWLHIQQPSLKFKTLENVVVHCSHIDSDLRRIAVEAMERVKEKFSGISECGAHLEPGSILRYIGERDNAKDVPADSRLTEPVIFLSSPFLTLQPLSSRRASKFEYRPRSLLQSLYGYDVGGERESGQVVQKLNITKSKKDMLHINQLWCLSIGSKVLITMSEQSAAEIRGDSIAMDPRRSNNKEPLVVRLTDRDDREYRMVVERDCNYVDFLIYAVARVAGQDADAPQWDLFDENNEILTPNRWIEIMSSTGNTIRSFLVKEKIVVDSGLEATARADEDTLRTRAQRGPYSRHASRSSTYVGRASDSRTITRRSRSQYELGGRRSTPRPRSYHGEHLRSRSMVSARERLAPPRSYPGFDRERRGDDPYGPRSLVTRDKPTHREYYQPFSSESMGVLVPYNGKPSEVEESSRPDIGIHRPNKRESSESLVDDGKLETRHEVGKNAKDDNRASSSSSATSNVEGVEHEDTNNNLETHGWSHLSDIIEERSSSAPTPMVGASSGRDGSESSPDESESEDNLEPETENQQNRDPRNMQLILRPKGLGLEPESFAPVEEPPSSEHSAVTIDISEPWRGLVDRPASTEDEPRSHDIPESLPSLGPSYPGDIDRNVQVFGSFNQVSRPGLSPAEEALLKEGAALDDLYTDLVSAINRGAHAAASEIEYHYVPEKELVIQQLLQAAITLPEEWEVNNDLEAAIEQVKTFGQDQQNSGDYSLVKAREVAVTPFQDIIAQKRVIRRLKIVKRTLTSRKPAISESKLAEAMRRLESLRESLRAAESEGDIARAADLMYYAIPDMESTIKQLSDDENNAPETSAAAMQPIASSVDGRPLDRVSVLHWAHSKGFFSFHLKTIPLAGGFPEPDYEPLPWPSASDGALIVRNKPGSSPTRSNQRHNKSPPVERQSTKKPASTRRYRVDINNRVQRRRRSPRNRMPSPPNPNYYRRPSNPRQDRPSRSPNSRYYEAPRPLNIRSRSRSRSPPSLSRYSAVYSSDEETLAPGVILNELPPPRRHVPEVYDPEIKPETTPRERPQAPEEWRTRGPLGSDSSNPTQDDDERGGVRITSTNTAKDSGLPTTTRVTRYPSADDAREFRRTVLRRYAPTPELQFSRIKIADGPDEVVEDEEADGPFAEGCRKFYRKDPSPAPGQKVDWVDEYVIDQRNLPFSENVVFIVPVEWPPLPDGTSGNKSPSVAQCTIDPFLRWRVKSSDQNRTPEEVDKSVLKVLGNMDESLQSGVFYQLYMRTFMCTLSDLFERHEFLTHLPEDHEPVLDETKAGVDGLGKTHNNTTAPEEEGPWAFGLSSKYKKSKKKNSPIALFKEWGAAAGSADESKRAEEPIANEPLVDESQANLGHVADKHGPDSEESGVSHEEKLGLKSGSESGTSSKDGSARHSVSEKPQPDGGPTPKLNQRTSNDPQGKKSNQQTQSMGTLSHDQTVMKSLLEVSKDLLGAYMPTEGSPLLNSVCLRFWGNVDEIFRQVTWQTMGVYRSRQGESYIIRDFDVPSNIIGRAHQSANQKRSWSSCPQCKSGQRYRLITEALAHLHKDHFDCSAKIHQPYDDPCFVWLRRLHVQLPPSTVGHLNVTLVEDFVSELLGVSRYSRELHHLVASIHGSETRSRPQLPTNIVLAFEQIMAMYMIHAHRLSLNNARATYKSQSGALSQKIDELVVRGDMAKRKVIDHLTEAKKDIILLRGTSRQIDSLSVEAVGAEFLVLNLITNLQNRSLVNKPAPNTADKVDFVELYQRYTSSLRFQANRRPKKRVFLDIHGLEEELDALHSMLESQKSLLCNYLKLLSPGSTRATNATRVGQYKIERAYARKQQKNLDAKEDSIRILREKSQILKEQVKKIIEILEEDHGKAIRVFTFVTLLFLPLSFVTSFMGMNTVDVRDTEWSQKIFWVTGLPVTLVVVIFALIYAYRGERIQDWMLTNIRPSGRHTGRSMGGSFAWSGELPGDGDTFLVRGGLKKRGVIQVDSDAFFRPTRPSQYSSEPEWMRDARKRLLSMQRERETPGVRRRRTGEALTR